MFNALDIQSALTQENKCETKGRIVVIIIITYEAQSSFK